MNQTDTMEQLLMGMIAGLFMRGEVHGMLRRFTIDRTDSGDALVLHFTESGNTFRIKAEFIANIEQAASARKVASES